MAKKFNVPIDLGFLELLNAKLHMLEEDPSTGDPEAVIYYNSDTNKITFHNGTSWVTLTDSGSVVGVTSIAATGPLSNGGNSTGAVTLSIAAASGSTAGSMSTTHFDLVNNATNANTASAIVKRDGSGNFSAGTITASLSGSASQLNNQDASYYLSRTNHTDSQTASTISDLATTVKAYRLDEFAVPTTSVAFNNQKITGLGTPTASTDAVTKAYVDGLSSGLDYKDSVRAATTTNITLSGAQTIDGVSVVATNRVLVKNQNTGADNGIYVASAGAWTRAADASTGTLTSGAFVYVEEGTANGGNKYVLSTTGTITVGTTSQTWVVYGAGEVITAGDGLDKTGSELSVVGTASRISVSGSGVDIHTSYVGQSSITTLGTVTTGTWQGTTVGVGYGGTGIASYTTGNYIRASGSTTLEQRTPANVLSDIGAAASGHNHTVASLSDVTITSNSDGELLRWNGSAWINNTLAEAGISATSHNHTLDSLSNVTITANASGEILKWNGSAWINNTLTEAGISATGHAHSASDVTSGTLAVARGGTGIASYTTGNFLSASGATTLVQRTPAQVLSDIGAAAASHAHTLDSSTNVTITSNSDGEILRWNGSAWINNTLAEAGISGTSHNHTLDSLSNVTITGNSSGEILKWNGSAWINNTLSEAGAVRKFAANIDDDAETVFNINHALGTTDVTFTLWNSVSGFEEIADVEIIDGNNVEVTFATPPLVVYRIVITG